MKLIILKLETWNKGTKRNKHERQDVGGNQSKRQIVSALANSSSF